VDTVSSCLARNHRMGMIAAGEILVASSSALYLALAWAMHDAVKRNEAV
jgi:hypothetical protein